MFIFNLRFVLGQAKRKEEVLEQLVRLLGKAPTVEDGCRCSGLLHRLGLSDLGFRAYLALTRRGFLAQIEGPQY